MFHYKKNKKIIRLELLLSILYNFLNKKIPNPFYKLSTLNPYRLFSTTIIPFECLLDHHTLSVAPCSHSYSFDMKSISPGVQRCKSYLKQSPIVLLIQIWFQIKSWPSIDLDHTTNHVDQVQFMSDHILGHAQPSDHCRERVLLLDCAKSTRLRLYTV